MQLFTLNWFCKLHYSVCILCLVYQKKTWLSVVKDECKHYWQNLSIYAWTSCFLLWKKNKILKLKADSFINAYISQDKEIKTLKVDFKSVSFIKPILCQQCLCFLNFNFNLHLFMFVDMIFFLSRTLLNISWELPRV